MDGFIKTNSPGYFKDPSSGAIINTNDEQYRNILMQRDRVKETKAMTEKMTSLETELSEIKSLLMQVINGRQNG